LFQEDDEETIWFNFQKTKYLYERDKKQFVPLDFPVSETIQTYMESKGLQEEHDIKHAENTFGKNL
jgi:cation-transporting ATPase 13A1